MSVTAPPSSTINALSVLAQNATSSAQLAVTREIGAIDIQIEKQLNAKIAALQPPADDAVGSAIQSQITSLQAQQSQFTALSSKYGANANILPELQTALADLQTAASGGNSTGFDATLAQATVYLNDLAALGAPAPLRADGIAGLQGTGLGIASSATYNLATPSGQAAAAAAVSKAQTAVGNVFSATTSNQLLATDLSTALESRITGLQQQQQQQASTATATTQAQIQQLTQQAHNDEHLIELALGNTTTLATAIFAMANPPPLPASPFAVLLNSVGATANSSPATGTQPPILSLLT
ncbi:MAG: hypothetical protein ACREFQ_04365 [Stellaceae bacterium]